MEMNKIKDHLLTNLNNIIRYMFFYGFVLNIFLMHLLKYIKISGEFLLTLQITYIMTIKCEN